MNSACDSLGGGTALPVSGTALVALLSPPYAGLTYLLPRYLPDDAWRVGQRVAVPLGKTVRVGVLLEVCPEAAGTVSPAASPGSHDASSGSPAAFEPREAGSAEIVPNTERETAAYSLKPLLWPLDRTPLLSSAYLDMAVQLGKRQGASPGRILGNLLPAGLRTAKVKIRVFGSGKPREVAVKGLAGAETKALADLGEAWEQGRTEVVLAGRNPLDAEVCVLSGDPPWPVRPAAKMQLAVLEYIFERGAPTRRQIMEAFGPKASATLSLLAGRELLRILPAGGVPDSGGIAALSAYVASGRAASQQGAPLPAGTVPGKRGGAASEESAPDTSLDLEVDDLPPIVLGSALQLTPHQREAFAPLREAAFSGVSGTHLLFGLTGSGKTAIYMELARDVLASGRSVLLLAPEVALALKLWNDAALTLPDSKRVLFHGYLTPLARERIFRDAARRQEPVLAIGTRSALFLPLDDIGLIILDEEHDSSFKQDEGFTYQAKEVAWYRAGQHKALLLLGSATPDIKTFHAALEGKIPLHRLSERVGGATLPEVRLVRLPRSGADAQLLAPESAEALNEVVRRGEQAIILLNRRGYAPQMYCLSCAATVKCPHCDIGLAYHKGRERLLCHYCGYSLPFPSPCASCGGLHFLPMGEGTEKLEEHLSAVLPAGTAVLRLDRDSTRRPGRMEAILAAFARKEASVLVGTQMLSKGHHFPDVTLAVVADADLGLNMPDYRAAERTFQLLLQSSGRSGRGEKSGCVLVQTRDPSHYCWEFVRQADYEGFFARELALREKRRYPPFVHLALLRISFAMDNPQGLEQVLALGAALRIRAKELGVSLLGPAPAPLPFLKSRRRFHCLLKGNEWNSMRLVYGAALEAASRTVLRVTLDIDPVNML